jgi:hypothetical protein
MQEVEGAGGRLNFTSNPFAATGTSIIKGYLLSLANALPARQMTFPFSLMFGLALFL